MTAAQLQSLDCQGVHRLEVRWIFPGQLTGAVRGWFGRFPAETTSFEDAYLLDPHLPGLSVKVGGGRALEVKVYRGSPGLLEVAGRACGRLEFWPKWSFPHGPPSHGSSHPAGWRPVSKYAGSAGSPRQPGWELQGWARSQDARWNSPRSACMASAGGLWASRQPAQPMRCAANSMPPPHSCSPRPRPVTWNWARMTPSPTRSGCADGRVPGNTEAEPGTGAIASSTYSSASSGTSLRRHQAARTAPFHPFKGTPLRAARDGIEKEQWEPGQSQNVHDRPQACRGPGAVQIVGSRSWG